jgi:hypothetical protein
MCVATAVEDLEDIFSTKVRVELPTRECMQIEALLRQADYLMASEGPSASVRELYKKALKLAAPYAKTENGREELFRKSKTL